MPSPFPGNPAGQPARCRSLLKRIFPVPRKKGPAPGPAGHGREFAGSPAASARARVRAAARRSAGFTLLETMVALVIFTGAAMALYSLYNTNLLALVRVHDVTRQIPAARHAIEYLSSINPREEESGRIEIHGLDVAWSSKLLQPVRDSQTLTGGRGYYEVGLYEVEFAMRDGERSLGTWRLRVPGYEKVRTPDL